MTGQLHSLVWERFHKSIKSRRNLTDMQTCVTLDPIDIIHPSSYKLFDLLFCENDTYSNPLTWILGKEESRSTHAGFHPPNFKNPEREIGQNQVIPPALASDCSV